MAAQPLQLDSFIPYRLSVAANAASAVIATLYQRRFGISIPEWRVVAILGEGAPLAPRGIVSRAKLDKVTVSRAAKALEDRGLIARSADDSDQRSHRLMLTPEGRTLYETVAPEALALEARLLAGFAEWERGALESLLRRVEAAAEACGA
ncbi:MarR family transcriptional regulator [Sphingomonas sp. DBB INV C78]|uniref:MarR family winged helix-turn-helix transcriptional regulator n=1 Tax=Sphingomonas sp. DBB INV C78 TaxID=3349434 RepID=UPI0036D28E03